MNLTTAIRDRLAAIAAQAGTAAEALAGADALDLDAEALGFLLTSLDAMGTRLDDTLDRLGAAVDPSQTGPGSGTAPVA
jgi:hypothetical protein